MATDVSQAYKPLIKIEQWGGEGGVAATSSSFSAAIGKPVSITLDLILTDTKAESEAKEVTSDAILQRLAKNQIAAFEGKTSPDTIITLKEDDEGGISDPQNGRAEFKFNGYSLENALSVSPSNISITGSALIEWADIEHLNYSIYPMGMVLGQNTEATGLKVEGDTIVDIIKNVETKLRERWPLILKSIEASNPQQAMIWSKIHARNTILVPRFHEILQQSAQTMGWTKVQQWIKDTKGGSMRVKNSMIIAVMKILTTSSGSFLGTLNRLADLFQCILVPGMDDKIEQSARFVNKAYAVAAPPEELPLDLLQFNAAAGLPDGLLPVTSFMMQPVASQNTESVGISVKNLVLVPQEAASKGGAIAKAPHPEWWFDSSNPAEIKEATRAMNKGITEDTASLKPTQAEQQKIVQAVEKDEKTTYDVAKAWALCHYAWVSLGKSQVAVTVSGMFKYAPGKRYRICVKNTGVFLFTGFLSAVTTNVSVKGGCNSQLQFTHVTFPGFELPGKAEIEAAGLLD